MHTGRINISKTAFFLFLTLLLGSSTALYAKSSDNAKYAGNHVAVLDFNAFNMPQFLADAITDLFSAKLFEIKLFTMIERSQMDKILKEHELQSKGCTDSSCAVEAGKALSAEKIIIGSLHKVDNYKLYVKFIDVATGKADAIYLFESDSKDDFEEGVAEIIDKINYEYSTDTEYHVHLSFSYLNTLGDFSNLANNGYGINCDLMFSNLLSRKTPLLAYAGLYYIKGLPESIYSITLIPLSLNIGYSYTITKRLNIVPYIGGGYLVEIMSYDADGKDDEGDYEYTREITYTPLTSFRIDLAYKLTKGLGIFFSPSYTLFYEKDSIGQYVSYGLGVEIIF